MCSREVAIYSPDDVRTPRHYWRETFGFQLFLYKKIIPWKTNNLNALHYIYTGLCYIHSWRLYPVSVKL